MRNIFKKFLSIPVFMLLFIVAVTAEENNKTVLFGDVEHAKSAGTEFVTFKLFENTTGTRHNILSEETILSPKRSAISDLFERRPNGISIQLRTATGKTYTLDMMRSYPLASQADMGYIDATGRHTIPAYNPGVHYQGALAGQEHSLATLSVFASGEVMMMFANDEGNFVVGKLDNDVNYVLYNDGDFTEKPPMPCGTSDEQVINEQDGTTGAKTTAAYQCNKVSFYWEADYGLYQYKNSSTVATNNYLEALINNVQALYRNERIAVELKSTSVWTTDDKYGDSTSYAGLSDFTNAWKQKGNAFNADLAMLIARDPGGNGGVAWLNQLCGQLPFAYGDVNGSFVAIPTYSWDVQMVTHELGHNLGSHHTHWCGWNTGVGGKCGAIDNCYKLESGSGCSTCTYTFSNSAPTTSWKGTIMSYCHLKSRGIDLANGFGPLPGDKIRSSVSSKSCLKSIISATLTPTPVCKDYGKVSLAFDNVTGIGSGNFGTPNYTYKWSVGNIATKDIVVTKPGSYTVTVTDSNGCTANFTTNVPMSTDPGCSATGINEVTRQHVSMYPNPAHDNVLLKYFSRAGETTTIKVTDVTGKVIKVQTVQSTEGENNININLSGMNSGMYYINILSNNNIYQSLKLVVE